MIQIHSNSTLVQAQDLTPACKLLQPGCLSALGIGSDACLAPLVGLRSNFCRVRFAACLAPLDTLPGAGLAIWLRWLLGLSLGGSSEVLFFAACLARLDTLPGAGLAIWLRWLLGVSFEGCSAVLFFAARLARVDTLPGAGLAIWLRWLLGVSFGGSLHMFSSVPVNGFNNPLKKPSTISHGLGARITSKQDWD